MRAVFKESIGWFIEDSRGVPVSGPLLVRHETEQSASKFFIVLGLQHQNTMKNLESLFLLLAENRPMEISSIG